MIEIISKKLIVTFYFIIGFPVLLAAQSPDKDLATFLGKLKNYVEDQSESKRKMEEWQLPNLLPDSEEFNMPSPDIRSVHPETGLIISFQKKEIYDRETGYVFNTESFSIYRRKEKLGMKQE